MGKHVFQKSQWLGLLTLLLPAGLGVTGRGRQGRALDPYELEAGRSFGGVVPGALHPPGPKPQGGGEEGSMVPLLRGHWLGAGPGYPSDGTPRPSWGSC